MAFADILSKPNWEKIFITETHLGHRVDGDSWTQHGTYTNCWYIEHDDGVVDSVYESGLPYTVRADLATLDSNASSWFYDDSVSPRRLYLHMEDSDDPGIGTKYLIMGYFWEYICSSQDAKEPVIFNNHYYLPYLNSDSVPDVVSEVSDYHEGGVRESFGSVSYINADGYFDSRLNDYVYENRLILVKITYRGAPSGDVAILWRGWVGDVSWSENEVVMNIEDARSS